MPSIFMYMKVCLNLFASYCYKENTGIWVCPSERLCVPVSLDLGQTAWSASVQEWHSQRMLKCTTAQQAWFLSIFYVNRIRIRPILTCSFDWLSFGLCFLQNLFVLSVFCNSYYFKNMKNLDKFHFFFLTCSFRTLASTVLNNFMSSVAIIKF